MPDRPLVIVTEPIDPECLAWLADRCDVHQCAADDPASAALLAKAHGLVVRTYTRVDAAMLDTAPNLRVVARAGVGLDNVDQEACKARGIVVRNTPDANTRAVVELVLAFMLDTLRPRPRVQRSLPADQWKQLRKDSIAPTQLYGSTLGIVGLGRIGKVLAAAVASFGVRTLYHDVEPIPEPDRQGAQPVSFQDLLAQADIISLHVDSRPANKHLLDADTLAHCKPSVLLINTSRGFVLDPSALAAFLNTNPAAQACLDVHEPEPIVAENPLLSCENAMLTPHIGAATAPAHKNMSWVVRDVWDILSRAADE